jgi:CheY-like chemotaxis protein
LPAKKHTMPRILVIDDSESVLAYLTQVLRAAGHTVFAATSGREAVEVLEREPLDLVITDIYMPPPDGLEVMRLAREMKLKLPFIAMSSRPAPLNMFVPARGLGAHLSLQKPFARERLLEAVVAVLDVSLGTVLPPVAKTRPRELP